MNRNEVNALSLCFVYLSSNVSETINEENFHVGKIVFVDNRL